MREFHPLIVIGLILGAVAGLMLVGASMGERRDCVNTVNAAAICARNAECRIGLSDVERVARCRRLLGLTPEEMPE